MWTFWICCVILKHKFIFGVDLILDFNAFEFIQNALAEELAGQGFGKPEALEFANGKAVMFTTADVAYSLQYNENSQQFGLCSATLDGESKPANWRNLSVWMFDKTEGTKSDAESILNDFLEVIRGPKRVAIVQQKRKRGKDDDRNVDPMFFVNRLVNIFPELKNELNEEKITYGQVRYITFIKAHVVSRCEDLIIKYPDSEPCKKLCALFDDMYKNGDLDLRSILTFSLFNSMSDTAFSSLYERVGEELQKNIKYTRKLKNKKIKPEKKKKQKKVEARLKA